MNKTPITTKGQPRRERADVLEFTTGDKPLRVDREKGVVYGVKIIGNESRNNRTYPQAVLTKARGQYERRSVNISHPPKENAAGDRPFESFFGRLENITDDDGLRVCESINTVRSVDLVCRPATTNGIFESESEGYMDGSQPGGGDGVANLEAMPEAPATVKQMFLDAAAKIFDEDDGDPADKARRIAQLARTLLQVEDDVDAAVNGEGGDGDDEGQESVGEKQAGQQAAELADARKRLAGYERRERARDALEAAK